MFTAGTRERIELRAAIVLGDFPLGGNPAFLFELVQCGIERAVADLQNVAGDLLQAQADGEAVERLQREDFQQQQVESALHEIRGLAHALTSVTERSIALLPSVSKGKVTALGRKRPYGSSALGLVLRAYQSETAMPARSAAKNRYGREGQGGAGGGKTLRARTEARIRREKALTATSRRRRILRRRRKNGMARHTRK